MKTKWLLLFILSAFCWLGISGYFQREAKATTEVAVPAAGSAMLNARIAALQAQIDVKQGTDQDINAIGQLSGTSGYLKKTDANTWWLNTNLRTSEVNEANNLYYTDARARASVSESTAGLDYNNVTGVFTLTSGYTIPADACIVNWNLARLSTQNVTLSDANNIIFGKSTGGQIGTEPNQLLAFWGAAPVDEPNALTTQLTTITYTEPGTADYAIQDVVNSVPWGFADANEARTVLKVIKNLQDKVQELESRLEEVGLVQSN